MLADRLGHEKVSTTLNTYSHLFPHKQQELVHSLESLQATDSPTPEPPSDNPLLEAIGITCEVSHAQDNGSDVTIRPQFWTCVSTTKYRIRENHPDATKKDHIEEIQQSSGFLAIKVNNNHMKTIEKRVVAISSKLVAEQKKKSRNPLV